jgi:hypothetical protein
MYSLDSAIQVVRWYFDGNVLLIAALLALLYWGRKTEKRKHYVLCAVVCFGLICNDLVFWLVKKADEADTFYRVLWILPVTLLSAYLIVELADQLKGIRKGILIILTVLFVVINAIPSFENWVKFPSNIYQIDDEWIEIADMIDEHSGGKRVNVIDDYSVLWHAREYDDNLCMLGIGDYDLRVIITHPYNIFDKIDVESAIVNSATDYIIVPKEQICGNASLENAGIELIGQTDTYNVYCTNRFDIIYRQ